MIQKFLDTDSDDDFESPLYFKFCRQVSLPNFFESDTEKLDAKNEEEESNTPNESQRKLLIDHKTQEKEEANEDQSKFCDNFLKQNNIQLFHTQNQEELLLPESFFIISDIYNISNGRFKIEIILRLYRLPNFESNFIVHLKGKWINMELKANDPVLVIGSFKKEYCKPNSFSSFNYEATIDNKNGFIVLWPYFMISATRLSDSVHCLRRSILFSMVPYDKTQSDWTLSGGTIAHSLIENVLTQKIEDSNQVQKNINELVNKNIIENGLQGMTKNQMTDSLQHVADLANKLSTNLQNQNTAKKLDENISNLFQQQKEAQIQLETEKQKILAENDIQKKMEIQAIIDKKEIENQRIKQEIIKFEVDRKKLEILNNKNISSPPYGCEVVAEEKSMVSLQYSYNGICDLVLLDPKKQIYFPVEMKSGNSSHGQIWQPHQVQLSLYILMMKENLKEKASDYGKIFYMKDKATVTIQQSLPDIQSLELLRNSLIYKSMNQIVPSKITNTTNCSKCKSLDVCEFMNDIEDIELGTYKPRPAKNKTAQISRNYQTFYDDDIDSFQQELQLQLSLYQQLVEEDKENQDTSMTQASENFDDIAFQDYLQINSDYDDPIDFKFESSTVYLPEYNQDQINFYKKMRNEILNDIYENGYNQYFNWTKTVDEREKEGIAINGLKLLSLSKEMDTFLLINDKIKKSKFRNYSKFVVTKNGKQPILCTGVVNNTLPNSDFLIVSLDKKLDEGESDLCIDLIKYITDSTPQVHNLTRLFIYLPLTLKRVTSMLIEHNRSEYLGKPEEYNSFFGNLNDDQREAIIDSILAKDYTFISGCKSSGKTFLLANLVQYLSTKPVCVLIIGPSEKSIDSLYDLKKNFINDIVSVKPGYICATSINNFDDPFFFKKKYDILIVDDCEKIKMSDLIGPMNACSKFVFCGDVYQARNDLLSIFSFIDIEKNKVNFLRTKYSKSQEIHILENSMIYNYSTKINNNNSSALNVDLSKLNEFHKIHQNWLIPVLSSTTFFIDTDFNTEDDYKEYCIESAVSAALVVSLLACGVLKKSIGILCYDKKCPFFVKKSLEVLLESLPELCGAESVEVHHYSNYRDSVSGNNESSKVLIVCFGNANYLSSYEASLSILEAKERVYFVGRGRIMKKNPFFNKLLTKINGDEKLSYDVLQSCETPFNRISELI